MDLQYLIEKAARSVPQGGKLLGKGADGTVYAITDEVVLKIYHKRRLLKQEDAESEYEIGKDLHSQGVQVPHYFGVFKPLESAGLDSWGVFMERLRGVRCNSVWYSLFNPMIACQYDQQRELIDQLGYDVDDSYVKNNTIFNLRKWKVYLYDLTRWKKR